MAKPRFRKRRGTRRRITHRKMFNALAPNIPNAERQIRMKFLFSLPVTLHNTVGVWYPQFIFPLNLPNVCYTDDGNAGSYATIGSNANNFVPDNWISFIQPGIPLFDTYKVHAIKAQFIPSYVLVDTAVGSASPVDFAPIVYHYNDLDDSINVTVFKEQHYLNNGAFPLNINNLKSAAKFKYRQKREHQNQWLNTSLISNNTLVLGSTPSTFSTNVPPSMWGSLKLMFVGYNGTTSTQTLGRLQVEWDVTLRGISSTL